MRYNLDPSKPFQNGKSPGGNPYFKRKENFRFDPDLNAETNALDGLCIRFVYKLAKHSFCGIPKTNAYERVLPHKIIQWLDFRENN